MVKDNLSRVLEVELLENARKGRRPRLGYEATINLLAPSQTSAPMWTLYYALLSSPLLWRVYIMLDMAGITLSTVSLKNASFAPIMITIKSSGPILLLLR